MQCEAKTAEGRQCGANALIGSTRCLLHSGRASELGRRGGCRSTRLDGLKRIAKPRTAEQVRNLISQCVVEIRAGDLDPKRGTTLINAATVLLKAISVSDLTNRIKALESWVAQRNLLRRPKTWR